MSRLRTVGPERELLAYIAVPNATDCQDDALVVIDLAETSSSYGQLIRELKLPQTGDPLGRYTMASGTLEDQSSIFVSGDSSRIWPVISASEGIVSDGGPLGNLLVSAIGSSDNMTTRNVAIVDQRNLEVTASHSVGGANLILSYDMWCCPSQGLLVTSEACRPELLLKGLRWKSLVRGSYGHRLHMWDLGGPRPRETVDLGIDNQMVLSLAGVEHPDTGCYGFASVLISVQNLASSVWCWYKKNGHWEAKKVIEIPPEPCHPDWLPPALAPFGAVPPLLTDIKLSPNGRFLYASCWGTGELLQYDVINPLRPRLTGTVRLGGVVQRYPHPKRPVMEGGPHSLSVSSDGLRIYATNSASRTLDRQFYPGLKEGWMVKFDALPHGGLTVDGEFLVAFDDGLPQQILLSDETHLASR